MTLMANYGAAPSTEQFHEKTVEELEGIGLLIESTAHTATTEWSRASLEMERRTLGQALRRARAGQVVLAAQDEDGWYFALGWEVR